MPSSQSSRHFTVDVARDHPRQFFGCAVRETSEGLVVLECSNQQKSLVESWNQRCAATFPQDAVKPGDAVLAVNDMITHTGMVKESQEAAELLLQVRRDT